MLSHFHHHTAVAGLLLVFHVVTTTGCTSWKTQGGDVATVVATRPSTALQRTPTVVPGLASSTAAQPAVAPRPDTLDRIRVTTTSGSEVVLRNPRVTNDTLYGQLSKDGPVTAFPIAEISRVQVRKVSAGKTVALGVGVLAAAYASLIVWGALYFANQ